MTSASPTRAEADDDTENLAVLLQKFYMLGWEDRNATKAEAEGHGKVHATIIKILTDDESASTDESEAAKERTKG